MNVAEMDKTLRTLANQYALHISHAKATDERIVINWLNKYSVDIEVIYTELAVE